MIETLTAFAQRLNKLDPEHPGFQLLCDELLEELSPEIAENAFVAIFEFFKLHREFDLGTPGSLVHHIEHFDPNYIPTLLQDARSEPSYSTILMVNRVSNSDISESEQTDMLSILTDAVLSQDIPQAVRELASELVEYQASRQRP